MPPPPSAAPATLTTHSTWIVPAASAVEPPLAPDQMAGAMPLQQTWLGSPEKNFRPGWVRARWEPAALHFEILFAGGGARNDARSLNERTWTLGAVAEIFLLRPDSGWYLELHVTPENQRLQLRWPVGAIEAFRAGSRPLSDFLVWDPDWVRSACRVGSEEWRVAVAIPVGVVDSRLGAAFQAGLELLANVSRYDCSTSGEPVLSATAPLREPFYHRWADWHLMRLVPAAASAGETHGVSGSNSSRRK